MFVGPDQAQKRSAFWVLLSLAGVIATAGVTSDSTATVIGAMIVAPHPNLIDLIAALATGTVGAFALVRSDVSDTPPGVAIAISLSFGTVRGVSDRVVETEATPIATAWAESVGWRVASIRVNDNILDLVVSLVAGGQIELPAQPGSTAD